MESASAAEPKPPGLRYVTDREPGLSRVRAGGGFVYRDASGRRVSAPEALARIRALAIPPAYRDVWICPDPRGHLQATARDARGRKQYRYHPRWREHRDAGKFERVLAFGAALPAIRRRIARDMRRRGLPRERVLATVVRLLETTLVRVGNEEYAKANGSFGLTTLRDRHVKVDGATLRFAFRGKSGVEHRVSVDDPLLAHIVQRCADIPGQELFQWIDAGGRRHRIGSGDVNDYLRDAAGGPFTAKDYRTWFATLEAVERLRGRRPGSVREGRRAVTAAIGAIAERLGNTPTVCRKCYVHPAVVDAFLDGRLAKFARNVPAEAVLRALLGHAPHPRTQAGAHGRARRAAAVVASPGVGRGPTARSEHRRPGTGMAPVPALAARRQYGARQRTHRSPS